MTVLVIWEDFDESINGADMLVSNLRKHLVMGTVESIEKDEMTLLWERPNIYGQGQGGAVACPRATCFGYGGLGNVTSLQEVKISGISRKERSDP